MDVMESLLFDDEEVEEPEATRVRDTHGSRRHGSARTPLEGTATAESISEEERHAVAQRSAHIDHLLGILGLSALDIPARCCTHGDAVMVLGVVDALLALHQDSRRQYEHLQIGIDRLKDDRQQQDIRIADLKRGVLEMKGERNVAREALRKSEQDAVRMKTELKSAKDELKKTRTNMRQMQSQYLHETKKLQNQLTPLRERLQQKLSGRDTTFTSLHLINEANRVARPGGARGKWTKPTLNTVDPAAVSKLEERLRDAQRENENLRSALAAIDEDLTGVMKKHHLSHSHANSANTSVVAISQHTDATLVPPTPPHSTAASTSTPTRMRQRWGNPGHFAESPQRTTTTNNNGDGDSTSKSRWRQRQQSNVTDTSNVLATSGHNGTQSSVSDHSSVISDYGELLTGIYGDKGNTATNAEGSLSRADAHVHSLDTSVNTSAPLQEGFFHLPFDLSANRIQNAVKAKIARLSKAAHRAETAHRNDGDDDDDNGVLTPRKQSLSTQIAALKSENEALQDAVQQQKVLLLEADGNASVDELPAGRSFLATPQVSRYSGPTSTASTSTSMTASRHDDLSQDQSQPLKEQLESWAVTLAQQEEQLEKEKLAFRRTQLKTFLRSSRSPPPPPSWMGSPTKQSTTPAAQRSSNHDQHRGNTRSLADHARHSPKPNFSDFSTVLTTLASPRPRASSQQQQRLSSRAMSASAHEQLVASPETDQDAATNEHRQHVADSQPQFIRSRFYKEALSPQAHTPSEDRSDEVQHHRQQQQQQHAGVHTAADDAEQAVNTSVDINSFVGREGDADSIASIMGDYDVAGDEGTAAREAMARTLLHGDKGNANDAHDAALLKSAGSKTIHFLGRTYEPIPEGERSFLPFE